ncbi:MAG: carbohydrate kinase family protein [Dehalococcoidales bacterium]|nr:carbohydrate kinase family protein [Dehalococcoidales bacterium]
MSNIEVVGLGALNIDHMYRVERILVDGEAVVDELHSFSGGSAANTIYGLAKLGVNTGYTGVIGGDAGGKILLRNFQLVGVDTSKIRIKRGVMTGSVLCLSDKLGQRSLYVVPGVNSLMTIDDLDLTYINQAKWLHLSSFADDTQFEVLLELMNRLDSSVNLSFSPGVLHSNKKVAVLKPILSRTTILFVNQHEIQHLTQKDIVAGAELCLRQGCHMVVVTLGKGMILKLGQRTVNAVCYIRGADGEYVVEPISPDVISEIDSTGAGDAFAAGFLYGTLNGKQPYDCGCIGDLVARLSLTKLGAREGLPNFTKLAQYYHKYYNKEL